MDKLNQQTPDLTTENVKRIQQLFPSCITESEDSEWNIVYKVDFDLLRAELGDRSVTEWLEERYRLDWPGKKRSILKANTPINKTLRPVKKDSVDWDNTGNLYIEWDNFEVLKALQESYLGKIKMIYIDPPYNTGNDFVYNDNFAENSWEYKEKTEQNDEWYKMVKNTETNWRFHSDWLSMMYERLRIARDLLQDNWNIFISIWQDEIDNTIKIVKEIFWENNYLSTISRVTKKSSNSWDYFAPSVDYIVVATKKTLEDNSFKVEMTDELADWFKLEDEKWKYKLVWFYQASLELARSRFARYYIDTPDWKKCIPPENKRWRTVKETYDRLLSEDRIVFKETKTSPLLDENWQPSKWNVYTKSYLEERASDWYVPREYIEDIQNNLWTIELSKLNIPFSFAKPSKLIKYLISFDYDDWDIIMDFFSGSATVADAVMQTNAEKWVNLKYIMVQLPELIDEDSEAYKAGYKTICDIGKERIRRAAKKIKEETGADIDYGFRVYRVDDSCLKEVDNHPSEIRQEDLFNNISNIKEDRTPEDLLTQVILSLWLTLDLPIEEKTIKNNKVFYVAWNSLVACFDENVDFGIVEEIAKDQPLKLVFRDASFRTDADRINVENTMKRLSENTIVKVI